MILYLGIGSGSRFVVGIVPCRCLPPPFKLACMQFEEVISLSLELGCHSRAEQSFSNQPQGTWFCKYFTYQHIVADICFALTFVTVYMCTIQTVVYFVRSSFVCGTIIHHETRLQLRLLSPILWWMSCVTESEQLMSWCSAAVRDDSRTPRFRRHWMKLVNLIPLCSSYQFRCVRAELN